MSLPFNAESTLLSFPRDITLVSIKHKRMQILRISDNFRMYSVAFTQLDTRARLVLVMILDTDFGLLFIKPILEPLPVSTHKPHTCSDLLI